MKALGGATSTRASGYPMTRPPRFYGGSAGAPLAGFTDQIAFSRKETALLALTFGATVLMNLAEINNRFGILLLAFQAIVSLANPFSALMALAASQISADPVGWPLTTAQTLVCAWLVQVVVRGQLKHLRAGVTMIAVVAPYYVWHAAAIASPARSRYRRFPSLLYRQKRSSPKLNVQRAQFSA